MSSHNLQTIASNFPLPLREKARDVVASLGRDGIENMEDLGTYVEDAARDDALRAAGCWLLGHIGTERSLEILLSTARDETRQVALESIKSLGMQRSRVVVPCLTEILINGEECRRRLAANALGYTGCDDALPPLLAALQSDASVEVRCHVLEAIGLLGLSSSAPHVDRYLDHSDPRMRFWAAYALSLVGGESEIERLSMLVADPEIGYLEDSVGHEASRALETIRRRLERGID